MAPGTLCWSPEGAPMITVPRFLPGRLKWGPSLPMSRMVTAVARCSSAMVARPCPDRRRLGKGGGEDIEVDVCRFDSGGEGGFDDGPCTALVADHEAAFETLVEIGPTSAHRHGRSRPLPERVDIGGGDVPFTTDLDRRELSGADVAVGGHVMDPEAGGCLGEADRFTCHGLAPPLVRIVGEHPVRETRIRPVDWDEWYRPGFAGVRSDDDRDG